MLFALAHEHKHKHKKNICFSCAYAYALVRTGLNQLFIHNSSEWSRTYIKQRLNNTVNGKKKTPEQSNKASAFHFRR